MEYIQTFISTLITLRHDVLDTSQTHISLLSFLFSQLTDQQVVSGDEFLLAKANLKCREALKYCRVWK